MAQKKLCGSGIWFPLVCLFGCASFAQATIAYRLSPFVEDVPELDLCVKVVDGGAGLVDFTFYNQSTIDSVIARIYFDDDAGLLRSVEAVEGDGTSFRWPGSPHNLPGGRSLDPVFEAVEDLSLSAAPPLPRWGISPGEQATVTLALNNGRGISDVLDAVDDGLLRVGVHVLALPGGSSFSAVNIPLPATGILLGLGAAMLRARRHKTGKNIFRFLHGKNCSYQGSR